MAVCHTVSSSWSCVAVTAGVLIESIISQLKPQVVLGSNVLYIKTQCFLHLKLQLFLGEAGFEMIG